jgi:glycerol-3-phosphate acyltransferase PlsX
MGSDCSPTALFEAVELAARQFPDVAFIPFSTQLAMDDIVASYSVSSLIGSHSVAFDISPQFIEMSDEPLQSIRRKKNSTLIRGLERLKEGFLDAFITSGNTGALIAGSTLMLPLFPGIKRPALLAMLPSEQGEVALLDVGGHVSCKAAQLVEFALMGAAYQSCRNQIAIPLVGLLNIGIESKKGSLEERTAYELLTEAAARKAIDFIGNVEGGDLFDGIADVIVTNGFSGNVVLKTSEGVSHFILRKLAKTLAGIVPEKAQQILSEIGSQLDFEEYFGALICGVDGIVIKCHGQSTSKGLLNGIRGAIQLARDQFIPQMKAKFIQL